MQRPRSLLLAPRWALLRRDLLDPRGRFLESQPPLGGVNMRQFRLVGPVQIKPRRDGPWPGARCAQAAFQAAPMGSSWGLPAFEPRWRAGTLPPVRLRAGAAISMATATSGPSAGGSRDILWRVSAPHCGARAQARAGQMASGCACALGGKGDLSEGSVERSRGKGPARGDSIARLWRRPEWALATGWERSPASKLVSVEGMT